jgi:hypothetical protein
VIFPNLYVVAFEALTPVVMKISIFWDIMPCSQFKVNRRFEGKCHFHLHGGKITRARKELESRWQTEVT